MNTCEKEYVTVVSIEQGLITLIEPDGTLNVYRQTRITDLKEEERQKYINERKLVPNWQDFPQIPRNYRILAENKADDAALSRAFFPDK